MNIKKSVNNQSMIYNILKQDYLNKRLSHAYLFYGDKGTGKKEMAYALACMLYCENGGCLECETCKSIIENSHMNVDYIGIDANKTMISKEQILDLQEEFSKTSLVDGTRIYIVDGIDTASSAAQNSLLKFIEEPVNQTPTIGIFLATDLSNVVSTIQSRCVLEHFKPLPSEVIKDELIASGIDELDAILASNLTNSDDSAKEIVKSSEFPLVKLAFLDLLNIENNKNAILYYLNNVSVFTDPNNMKTLLKWVILFLEDANLFVKGSDSLILQPLYDKIRAYNRKNEKYLRDKLKLALDLSNKLKYNVSAKNVFHELVTKFI